MKAKIGVLVLVVAVVAGYWGYTLFLRGGPADDDRNIRSSFQAMTTAIASGNTSMAGDFLAPTFSDKKVSKEDFLKILAAKRALYDANIQSVTAQGDLATINYNRTEKREEGEQVTAQITGETWIRDDKNKALWKLHRLAPNDKWFRTFDIPGKKEPVAAAKAEKTQVLGTLEKGSAQPVSMAAGERYNPVGKRDPFKSLIAIDEGAGEEGKEICEPERPRELLENYNLMSLKLSGVIQSGKGPLALIEAPDGKGYTVRTGMYLGKSCGKIVEIKSDYLLVLEQVRKPGARAGAFEPVETLLKLRPEEG